MELNKLVIYTHASSFSLKSTNEQFCALPPLLIVGSKINGQMS
jgi:hypothetical protein